MDKIIAIRREDKNEWERRTPLIPAHIQELKEKYGIQTIVQPSKIRIFTDEEYRAAGAEVNEDISRASVVFAVKEIPMHMFQEGKTYVFFSHTIKGQDYNMPMLKKLIEKKCNLIDYEKVVDEKNRRLIFFGRYAGMAGMIETLHAYAQRVKLMGYDSPFEKIKQPFEYQSIEEAMSEIEAIGKEIDENGFPPELCPLVVAFTGYGNVSRGAQEIFNLLPHKTMSPQIIDEMYENFSSDNYNLYKVVFQEEDMFRPREGLFNLQDYYDHPENYISKFDSYLRYIDVLVNCIYWEEKYPRLVTREYLKNEMALQSFLKLKVIGDITCDIDGSIEITHKETKPDNPTYTYLGDSDRFQDGTQRSGVTVMAVDNLPCEFPRESSSDFSTVLKDFVDGIVSADFNQSYEELEMPAPMKKAQILLGGKFNPDYRYMEDYLK